jgi:hypothetical protein
MIEKNFNSKVKKVLLLIFFKISKMKNFRHHFFSINFWVDSNNSKIQKSVSADFAYPPFSKISSIQFFFDSKIKKVLLLNFFKISKMKNFCDHFFGLFLPKIELKNFSFLRFWKNLIVRLFLLYYQLFSLSRKFLKMTLFFLKINQKTPFSFFFTIQDFFNSKV